MDVIALISNCPQLNNPCNGYNPTPVRMLIWDPIEPGRHGPADDRGTPLSRRTTCRDPGTPMFRQGPDRQPRRDRLPRDAHPAPHAGWARWRSHSEADAARCTSSMADEAVCVGTGPRCAAATCDAAHRRRIAGHRRAGDPSRATASCPRTRLRRAVRTGRTRFPRPHADQMRRSASSTRARDLAGRPACRWSRHRLLDEPDEALAQADRIGYPVMLKSTAGGGGIGMQVCRGRRCTARRLRIRRALGAGELLGRRRSSWSAASSTARHVEVQVFGDGTGRVLALGERDCSVQRRNQKVFEETPAPSLRRSARAGTARTPCRLGGR